MGDHVILWGLLCVAASLLALAWSLHKHPPTYSMLYSDRYGFIDGSAD